MEIAHVRAFLTLTEELHFGRAARRLYVTQPALSRMIRGLETELGERLFERSTRSVRLTSAGEALQQPAREFIDVHDRAVAQVTQVGAGQIGRVRMRFAGASSHTMVSTLVKAMHDRHPGVLLELHSSTFADVRLTEILDGAYDLALGRWRAIPAGLRARVLLQETFVVAVPSWHPKAAEDSVHFGELVNEPFIHLPDHPGSEITESLFALSERYGIEPHARHTAPDTWTALALVGAGLGVTLTLSTVRSSVQFPGVSFVELEDELDPVFLSLVWRGDSSNAALSVVLECANQVLPQLPERD